MDAQTNRRLAGTPQDERPPKILRDAPDISQICLVNFLKSNDTNLFLVDSSNNNLSNHLHRTE